ncbi:hypothetical protein [Ornithinibacillus halotolerans]|uniref:Uncharacterized protein n=1 Tax=Ornithinibacillus halotolerans TaxID=1274357 RepID=A0A916S911_9BACI|nr:hypothetical protein [Ornithinibacillus halotolerans]GGA89553.1 hypothetical protein GCM10008025_35210 [Ornithinibacillus halotolerans]
MKEVIDITEEEIKRYFDLNKQKKEIETTMNELKKKFHDVLDNSFGKKEKGEIQRGRYKLQRQIRSSVNYDEEGTVKKLEELNLKEFIVERKVPDTDKLESALKLGLVEENDFIEQKKVRITQSIVVKETFSSEG